MSRASLSETVRNQISHYDRKFRKAIDEDQLSRWMKEENEIYTGSKNVGEDYRDRYLLELLQNAQDAMSKVGVIGDVHLAISDDALLIADQGCGFDHDSIEGIFFLGAGKKTAEESIGHKGLGFRSVLQLTNRPQFIQDDIAFEFNENKLTKFVSSQSSEPIQDGLAYFHRPFMIDADDFGTDEALIEELKSNGYTFILRLPFREGIDIREVSVSITQNLEGPVLLFLPNIKSVTIQFEGKQNEISSDLKLEIKLENEVSLDEVVVRSGYHNQAWLRFRKTLFVDEVQNYLLDGLRKWDKVRKLNIHVAVPVDAEGELLDLGEQPIYSYFPTTMSAGISFILDAPFYLSLNRNSLHDELGLDLNRFLLKELSSLFAVDACECLASRNTKSPKLLRALSKGTANGVTGVELRNEIYEKLESSRLVPTVRNVLLKASETTHCSSAFLDLEELKDSIVVDEVATPNLVNFEIQNHRDALELVSHLGSTRIETESELSMLKMLAEIDLARYYRNLSDWSFSYGQSDALKEILLNSESLKNIYGKWLIPHENLSRIEQGKTSDLPYSETFEFLEVPLESGRFVELLDWLGIEELDQERIARGPISKILAEERREDIREMALRFLEDWRLGGSAPDVLDPGVTLRCLDDQSSREDYRNSKELYASSLPDCPLRILYGPFNECDFVDFNEISDAGIQDIDGFLTFLGVNFVPALKKQDSSVADYQIDRLDELLQNTDSLVRRNLWTVLTSNWNYYKPFARFKSTPADEGFKASQFVRTLRTAEWVPTLDLVDAEFATPSTLWWRPTASNERNDVWKVVPKPSWPDAMSDVDSFVKHFKFCQYAEPTFDALLRLMIQIYEKCTDEVKRSQYDVGQWALKEIARRPFAKEVASNRDKLRLFAQCRGRLRLDQNPLAVSDSRLRLIIGQSSPVLEVDGENLNNFVETFELMKIEPRMVHPVVGVVNEDLTLEFANRVERVGKVLEGLSREQSEEKLRTTKNLFASFVYCVTEMLSIEINVRGESERFDGVTSLISPHKNGQREFIVSTPNSLSLEDVDWESVAQNLAGVVEMQEQNILIFKLLETVDEEAFHREIIRRKLENTLISYEEEINEGEIGQPTSPKSKEPDSGSRDRETTIPINNTGPGPEIDAPNPPTLSSKSQAKNISGRIAKPAVIVNDRATAVNSNQAKRSTHQTPSELLQKAYRQSEVGNTAESFAVEYYNREVEKFRNAHPERTYRDPEWVSQFDATSPYDIKTFDEDGSEIHVEVKGTTADRNIAAFISSAELDEMKRSSTSHRIFRIWNLNDKEPKYLIYENSAKLLEESKLKLTALGFQLEFGEERS